MKKVLIVLLVSMIVAAGVAFAGTEGTDQATLTLNYKINKPAKRTLGWYDGTNSETLTNASFSGATDNTISDVTKYLKAVNSYSFGDVTLKVTLPKLAYTDNGNTSNIGYTTSVSIPSLGENVANPVSLSGNDTDVKLDNIDSAQEFATVGSDENSEKIGWVEFIFTLNKNDLNDAVANVDYTADVTVTMSAN